MKVRVRLFARLREVAGVGEVELEVGAGTTATGLVALLKSDFPRLGALLDSAAVAINGETAPAATVLKDGDDVALLPPFSGGRDVRRDH